MNVGSRWSDIFVFVRSSSLRLWWWGGISTSLKMSTRSTLRTLNHSQVFTAAVSDLISVMFKLMNTIKTCRCIKLTEKIRNPNEAAVFQWLHSLWGCRQWQKSNLKSSKRKFIFIQAEHLSLGFSKWTSHGTAMRCDYLLVVQQCLIKALH